MYDFSSFLGGAKSGVPASQPGFENPTPAAGQPPMPAKLQEAVKQSASMRSIEQRAFDAKYGTATDAERDAVVSMGASTTPIQDRFKAEKEAAAASKRAEWLGAAQSIAGAMGKTSGTPRNENGVTGALSGPIGSGISSTFGDGTGSLGQFKVPVSKYGV